MPKKTSKANVFVYTNRQRPWMAFESGQDVVKRVWINKDVRLDWLVNMPEKTSKAFALIGL